MVICLEWGLNPFSQVYVSNCANIAEKHIGPIVSLNPFSQVYVSNEFLCWKFDDKTNSLNPFSQVYVFRRS